MMIANSEDRVIFRPELQQLLHVSSEREEFTILYKTTD